MIARVRFVMSFSMPAGSRFRSSALASTGTGVAPTMFTAFAVAMKVRSGIERDARALRDAMRRLEQLLRARQDAPKKKITV